MGLLVQQVLHQGPGQRGPLRGRLYLEDGGHGLARGARHVVREAVALEPGLPAEALVLGEVLVTDVAVEGEEVVASVGGERQGEVVHVAEAEVSPAHVDHKVPQTHSKIMTILTTFICLRSRPVSPNVVC